MTFQSVWWYPNYVEYGSGLNAPKTWPQVQEQYRRPDALRDLRYYDLPCEPNTAKLYYNYPRMGQPRYRATFRDKPQTVARHYPGEDPHGKPLGFYGRVYYEDGPPTFKYQGPKKDELYWLERPPYLPNFPTSAKSRPEGGEAESMRGVNASAVGPNPKFIAKNNQMTANASTSEPLFLPRPPKQQATRPPPNLSRISAGADNLTTTYNVDYTNPTKRQTMDGVGFL